MCAVLVVVAACTSAPTERTATTSTATATATATATDTSPIDIATLAGRIAVTSDDDVWTADADGSDLRRLTTGDGPELDAAWAPDGSRVVYRDSQRGFNEDDEIFVVAADGTGATNLTRDPANDWGPAWSPDGSTIAFNSDRDGLPMGGYLMDPDGTDVRRIPTEVWVEYPTWSPDGTRIAFMGGASAGNYDIWVVGIDGTGLVRLTDFAGPDGWPAWSPDGDRIAFTSVRDDCGWSDADDCRTADTGEDDEHRDVWMIGADGTGLTRVTAQPGQFVSWSPDGRYLLVWGHELYVIRPDGTGRAPVDIPGIADGVFPDWIE